MSQQSKNKYFYNKRKQTKQQQQQTQPQSNFQKLLSSNQNHPVDQNSDIIILKYGNAEESNILEWTKKCEIDFLAKYGEVAQFFSTDKYYEPEEPYDMHTRYDNSSDPNKVLRDVRKTSLAEYTKKLAAIKEARSKIWGDMESRMSERSLDILRSNAEYNTLKEKYLRLIKQVHRSEPAVISPDETLDDALTKYYSLRQTSDESLTDYKNRFIAAIERIETADPTKKPNQSEVARRFTRYLDPVRFKNLIEETAKDQSKYKTTLAEAHEQAFAERRLFKGMLVPCETVTRDTNVVGATTDLVLTKNEIKTILQTRAEQAQHNKNNNQNNKKRKLNSNDKNNNDNNVNAVNNNKNNKNNKTSKYCDICQMTNHDTKECRKLSRVQEMFKHQRRERNDYSRDNSHSGGYQPRYHDNTNYSSSSNAPSNQVHYNYRSYDDNRRSYPQSVYYTDQRDDYKYNQGYVNNTGSYYSYPRP
jgi:hypothetical protein